MSKVIIAGSRTIDDFRTIEIAIDASGFADKIIEVVSGHARGVDMLGELWAKENGKEVTTFPAYWKQYGKSAGFIRNREMAEYADALIAIWDGKSKGTKHMVDRAEKEGLSIYVHEYYKGDQE
jgi:hypothetical protein